MIKLEYIPTENAKAFEYLLESCKRLEPLCHFVLNDSEGNSIKSRNIDELLKEMDGGDEEYCLEVYKAKELLGWFGILPYEDDGVAYDYGLNQFTERAVNNE